MVLVGKFLRRLAVFLWGGVIFVSSEASAESGQRPHRWQVQWAGHLSFPKDLFGIEYEYFLRKSGGYVFPEVSVFTGLATARNTFFLEVPFFVKTDLLHIKFREFYVGLGLHAGSSFALGKLALPILAPARGCVGVPLGYRRLRATSEYCVNFTYLTSQWGLGVAYDY